LRERELGCFGKIELFRDEMLLTLLALSLAFFGGNLPICPTVPEKLQQ
jgi:hypothetical protein